MNTFTRSLSWMTALFGLFLIYLYGTASGADIKGSSDHPLIMRYSGSEIIDYKTDKFDKYGLLIKTATQYGGKDKNLDSTMSIEGKVTKITYKTPKERTTLEIMQNYETALTGAGFQVIYTCSNKECGGRNFNHAVVPSSRIFAENYPDQRYLAAKLIRPDGEVYVSLYVVRNTSTYGPTHKLIYTQLDVIETQPMEFGMTRVNASTMAEEIKKTGRVALYGIYFDTGKSEIKPESQAALDEIVKLLKNNKSLELVVVGHTDNQGSFDHNMELSKRRAQAVVDKLVRDNGIQSNRLQYWGVGFLSPVASNKSEDGRKKNRRVELVEK